MIWTQLHPDAISEMLGLLPSFLSENDPRPAREQLNTAYAHGGGWTPLSGFKMLQNGSLKYPGDPALHALFQTRLRGETIRLYESAWVAIIQPDGSFEVARVD